MKHTLLVVLLCFFATLFVWRYSGHLTADHPQFDGSFYHDHLAYIDIAQHRISQSPFAYRIFTPLLVSLMPFALQLSWFIWSFCWMWAYGVVLYWLLREHNVWPELALVGALFYFTTAPAWELSHNFWLVDVPTFVMFTLALIASKRHNALAFIALVGVGALNREIMIIAIPAWFADNPRRHKVGLAATAVAISTLIILRVTIPVNGSFGLVEAITTIAPAQIAAWPDLPYTALWLPFIPYLLMMLSNVRVAGRTMRHYYLVVLLAFSQLLIANNTTRLVSIAIPIFTVAAMLAVQKVCSVQEVVTIKQEG